MEETTVIVCAAQGLIGIRWYGLVALFAMGLILGLTVGRILSDRDKLRHSWADQVDAYEPGAFYGRPIPPSPKTDPQEGDA
ncbi:MAG: hypothetical protein ETSY1_46770 (plasmid) [Candidatus Entotheonella factor]|uniref:Uncharacterized protein n=1 Tax=Entotheonella factor TaxID=1429438 RepID=W4M0A1_ENTF1|nr:MAG: hypothetical protein ETSY1_46770 [Candidatus Entotheonella factor]